MEKGNLIGQGRTAEIFAWGESDILKLYREGIPKNSIENEYRISKIVYDKGISTSCPRDIIEIDGRTGIIYQRINGKTMLSKVSSQPWNAGSFARKLADLHHAVHSCSAQGLPNQKPKLKWCINHTDMLTQDKKSAILKHLDSLDEDTVLCHGDFHPDNILISKDGIFIIDWMTGTTSNPLSDVARTCIMLSSGEAPPGSPFVLRFLIGYLRKVFYSEYIKRYLKISGLSMEQIDAWILPMAAARLVEWLPEDEKKQLLKVIDKKLEKLIA